jgi:hypothetical protein
MAVADLFIEKPDYFPNILAMMKITTAPKRPPPKIIYKMEYPTAATGANATMVFMRGMS